jgi:hypothetical protein
MSRSSAAAAPADSRSMAIDLTQWMVFWSVRWARAVCATSSAAQGSVGLLPTLRKSEPSAESVCRAAASHRLVHAR